MGSSSYMRLEFILFSGPRRKELDNVLLLANVHKENASYDVSLSPRIRPSFINITVTAVLRLVIICA